MIPLYQKNILKINCYQPVFKKNLTIAGSRNRIVSSNKILLSVQLLGRTNPRSRYRLQHAQLFIPGKVLFFPKRNVSSPNACRHNYCCRQKPDVATSLTGGIGMAAIFSQIAAVAECNFY
jgi:hypothetical protein